MEKVRKPRNDEYGQPVTFVHTLCKVKKNIGYDDAYRKPKKLVRKQEKRIIYVNKKAATIQNTEKTLSLTSRESFMVD